MLHFRRLPSAFVTGASGFIGGKIAERLLAEGRRVRVLSRRPLPHLEALGAHVVRGDLHSEDALRHGCTGAGTVFHVAGKVGVWGRPREFYDINVGGTRNVIDACRMAGVPRLVYTSSPSVVYNGGDLTGVDESARLCQDAPCAYPTSKALAEQIVLSSNCRAMATVALRPHLVWGPGDKNVVPRVLALAKAGRLKIIGSGRNRVDLTHITNVVDAHLLAETTLLDGPDPEALPSANPPPLSIVSGKAYFITNGEPVLLWDWINELLRGVGIPEIRTRIPLPVVYAAGSLLETWWEWWDKKGEPPMTRFVAREMATDHWFDISAARRDLKYHPRVTMAEGTADLIAHLKRNPV